MRDGKRRDPARNRRLRRSRERLLEHSSTRPRGRGGPSSRLDSRTSATPPWGHAKNSKWSLRVDQLVEAGERLGERSGWSTRCSVKAGTHRSVTVAITPSAPRPTRAARQQCPRRLARDLQHAAVRGHQLHRPRPARRCCRARPRAVGRGRQRAGQRLLVDVAQVLEREPVAASSSLSRAS